jgi:hypothetical protein
MVEFRKGWNSGWAHVTRAQPLLAWLSVIRCYAGRIGTLGPASALITKSGKRKNDANWGGAREGAGRKKKKIPSPDPSASHR